MRWGRLRRRTLCPLEIDAMKDACYASPHAATSHKGFGDSRQDSMVKLRIAHSAYSSRWPWVDWWFGTSLDSHLRTPISVLPTPLLPVHACLQARRNLS